MSCRSNGNRFVKNISTPFFLVMLMDELQAALENIDSPEHLPTCINPIVLIAQNYPAVSERLLGL